MAEQYLSGQQRLDLANASPAELLAFCVAVEMEGGDEVSLPVARVEVSRVSRDTTLAVWPRNGRWGRGGISIGGVGCVSIALKMSVLSRDVANRRSYGYTAGCVKPSGEPDGVDAGWQL